jgi:CRISPR/Cas system CSM-associated protein Csm3 (group 7 of RAMP superfamily)
MPEHQLFYSLTFRSPVSVFTGLGIAGFVDRTVIRDARQLPYIPGSTVKGRLRFFAERVLNTNPPTGTYCIHATDHPHCKLLDTACTLCRLFGNPALPALVAVGQASLTAPLKELFLQLLHNVKNPVLHPDADIRPGVGISRMRRTAMPQALFFDEAIPAASFAGTIHVDQQVKPHEREFLMQVGTLVDALGARKAAGRGALEGGIRITEVTA